MSTNQYQKQHQACVAFAQKNIVQCCKEIKEWEDTALLAEGKVRELAKMCAELSGEQHALALAKSYVTRAAIELIIFNY